jgi:WAS protein family homolog 1
MSLSSLSVLSLPLFSALQQLSQTVDSVFSKINHKLNDERAKVSKVNERVQTCAGKINLIRGSNKATTIFSTAKFPTSKQLMLRKTLFGINEEV